MSNAEAKIEITQSFMKVTKVLKGDPLGTVDIKTTKETWPLLEMTKEALERVKQQKMGYLHQVLKETLNGARSEKQGFVVRLTSTLCSIHTCTPQSEKKLKIRNMLIFFSHYQLKCEW